MAACERCGEDKVSVKVEATVSVGESKEPSLIGDVCYKCADVVLGKLKRLFDPPTKRKAKEPT